MSLVYVVSTKYRTKTEVVFGVQSIPGTEKDFCDTQKCLIRNLEINLLRECLFLHFVRNIVRSSLPFLLLLI